MPWSAWFSVADLILACSIRQSSTKQFTQATYDFVTTFLLHLPHRPAALYHLQHDTTHLFCILSNFAFTMYLFLYLPFCIVTDHAHTPSMRGVFSTMIPSGRLRQALERHDAAPITIFFLFLFRFQVHISFRHQVCPSWLSPTPWICLSFQDRGQLDL
ncbi:hypothetical protein HDV57DRAFT_234848 [Trichoderma longibrachiatum]